MTVLRDKVAQVFVKIHNSVLDLAETYAMERGRQIYITPTRFTENFNLFDKLLLRKSQSID